MEKVRQVTEDRQCTGSLMINMQRQRSLQTAHHMVVIDQPVKNVISPYMTLLGTRTYLLLKLSTDRIVSPKETHVACKGKKSGASIECCYHYSANDSWLKKKKTVFVHLHPIFVKLPNGLHLCRL